MDTGYPLWQLKLSLELYRAPRVLSLGRALSGTIHSDQSVIPGDGFATTMLKLLLIKPLDLLVSYHPTLQLAVVVGDIMIHRVGGMLRITREVADAAFRLQTLLEAVDVKIAASKSR
eukprot:2438908-Pyramimonas_sp.AAC.1